MKSLKLMWCVCLAVLCMVQTTFAGTTEDEISSRLERVGSVCVEGEDCGSTVMTTSVAAVAGDIKTAGSTPALAMKRLLFVNDVVGVDTGKSNMGVG